MLFQNSGKQSMQKVPSPQLSEHCLSTNDNNVRTCVGSFVRLFSLANRYPKQKGRKANLKAAKFHISASGILYLRFLWYFSKKYFSVKIDCCVIRFLSVVTWTWNSFVELRIRNVTDKKKKNKIVNEIRGWYSCTRLCCWNRDLS